MRKLFLALALLPIVLFAKDKNPMPDWMISRASETAYIGVGSCSMSEPNWQTVAEQNALNNLVQQISAVVETSSFLSVVNIDSSVEEMFKQDITTKAKDLVEGHEHLGGYNDKQSNTYYVCYKLDKQVYRRNREKKEREISSKAFSFLQQAQQASQRGELMRSLTYYEKGLQEVEPWLFLDLRMNNAGTQVNVPVELYNGYVSAFDGIRLSLSPDRLQLNEGGRQNQTITVTASRQQALMPNFPIQAKFIVGSGIISEEAKTNSEGAASFLLSSVTGKDNLSQVRFTVSPMVNKQLSPAYRKLLSTQTWPETVLTIETAAKPRIAYLHAAKDELPSAYKQIGAILGNNHFTLTPDPDAAEIFVDWQCTVEYAGVVPGEIQNLNECYVSLLMRFYDNKTQNLLSTYNIEQLRVLTPEKNSIEQTMAQCTRELMKRVRKELPKKLNF